MPLLNQNRIDRIFSNYGLIRSGDNLDGRITYKHEKTGKRVLITLRPTDGAIWIRNPNYKLNGGWVMEEEKLTSFAQLRYYAEKAKRLNVIPEFYSQKYYFEHTISSALEMLKQQAVAA